MSLVMPGTNGACTLRGVPAGKGKLVVPTMESMNPADWAVAAEVTVISGTETRVKAP